MKIPKEHSLTSFDVKSIFTYNPLEFTINVILRKICDENETETKIQKSEVNYYYHAQRMYTLPSITIYINSVTPVILNLSFMVNSCVTVMMQNMVIILSFYYFRNIKSMFCVCKHFFCDQTMPHSCQNNFLVFFLIDKTLSEIQILNCTY